MVRLELYKKILRHLLTVYSGLACTSDDYQDVNDYIDSDDIVNAATQLFNLPIIKNKFTSLLLSIIDVSADATQLSAVIPENLRKVVLFKKWGNRKYERRFCYCSPSLFVVDADFLYQQPKTIAYSQKLWMYLERICLKTANYMDLINTIAAPKHHCYILAYDKVALGFTPNAKVSQEELFSYALSASLHDKMPIEYHQKLRYDISSLRLNAFDYDKSVTYQQYYDIYDVLNDWLHSKDILSAFLRIYQIVEFLIYRQQMSEIIKVSSIKQSFLREIKSLNKKFENGEKTTIIENIPEVFGTLTASTAKIDKAEPFIKKYFGMNKDHTHAYLYSALNVCEKSKALARFIYDARCSIVHNKEAEFHISYNNYEVYKDVLPLLIEIHNLLAQKIWSLMNTPGSCISYENERYIDLF